MSATAEQQENIKIIRAKNITFIVRESFKDALNLREFIAAEIAAAITKKSA